MFAVGFSTRVVSSAPRRRRICRLYQIDQLITEPTRVTPTSTTVIDLILTNRSENISESGVIHLGISDHSLVYLVRKFTPPKSRKTVRKSAISKILLKAILFKIYIWFPGI